eukprot:gene8924-9012_t
MPYLASRDAGHLLGSAYKAGEMALLTPDLDHQLVEDPAMVVAACPYNLDAGPLRVVTWPEQQEFLSIAFYQPGGTAYFAVTDRAAAKGNINILVVTPKQLEIIEGEDDPDEPVPELRLRAPVSTGFVLVRSLVQRPSEREAAIKRVMAAFESGALAPFPGTRALIGRLIRNVFRGRAHVSDPCKEDDIGTLRLRAHPAALASLTAGFERDQ